MAFAVRLLDQDDTVVEILVMDHNFNPVLKGVDREKFPMLGSLDPYRDTSLDYAKCRLLLRELKGSEAFFASIGVAEESIRELRRLCALACAGPHRRLLFIGD
jgi:hypothetical protein